MGCTADTWKNHRRTRSKKTAQPTGHWLQQTRIEAAEASTVGAPLSDLQLTTLIVGLTAAATTDPCGSKYITCVRLSIHVCKSFQVLKRPRAQVTDKYTYVMHSAAAAAALWLGQT